MSLDPPSDSMSACYRCILWQKRCESDVKLESRRDPAEDTFVVGSQVDELDWLSTLTVYGRSDVDLVVDALVEGDQSAKRSAYARQAGKVTYCLLWLISSYSPSQEGDVI